MTCIGVLALQGGVHLHEQALQRSGFSVQQIRKPEQLSDIDGLVIPGGESSALLKLMAPWDFLDAVIRFSSEKKIVGTCAGAILLAREVQPQQSRLGLLDITVKRNAYGRQIDSFVGESDEGGQQLVFIRAPQITHVADDVDVILHCHGQPVLVRQGNIMAATFHPEMGDYRCVADFLSAD